MIERILKLEIPVKQSVFLWGARKTGKSTYLKQYFPKSIVFDFLKTDIYFKISKEPCLLREMILSERIESLQEPIILDEIQKVPQAMDEVHWLIENKGLRFILCGSSARKLRRSNVNLLGGRAWRFEMHPLVTPEIQNFNLIKGLNQGLIPQHYLQNERDAKRSLTSYLEDYLKEEIMAEGITRNVPAFSRFLDAFGYTHGELTNYANVARDCGIDSKTVKEYYQILVDTLLSIRVEPFKKRQSRQVITKASKYYMFDVGVAGHLTQRHIVMEKGEDFGRAMEHFILMELVAYRSYKELDFNITFWRTKTGLEVDFVLGNGEIAIEVKGSKRIDGKDFTGLIAFSETFKPKKNILICNEGQKRAHGKIIVMPWRVFLNELWDGKIIR